MSGIKFVQNIEKKLKEKKIKKTQMLLDLDIPKSSMNNWETNGNIPRGDIVYAIAQYLNVSMEYLVTGENPKEIDNSDKDLLYRWHELDKDDQEEISMMIDFKIGKKTSKTKESISAS